MLYRMHNKIYRGYAKKTEHKVAKENVHQRNRTSGAEPPASQPLTLVPIRVLQECTKHFAPRLAMRSSAPTIIPERGQKTNLQQRMSSNNTQKPLQSLSPALNHLIRESIRKYFSGQRRNINAGRFMLENVAKGFKVRVAPPDDGLSKFESGYIGLWARALERSLGNGGGETERLR